VRLDNILEAASSDIEGLVSQAREAGCRGPLVVGGSLVDGLGTALSDIDLMCFEPDGAAPTGGSVVLIERCQWGRLVVDVHRVAVDGLLAFCAPYREHMLAAPRRPLGRIPHEVLVALHALHSGLALADGPRLARIADAVGADFYPSIVGLRALGAFLNRHRDSEQLAALALSRPAMAAARGAAEAAADAGLAQVGRANPNPKWRVLLLEQAAEDPRASWLPSAELLAAIMDGPATGDVAAVLGTACRAAYLIASDTTLTIYHEAATTRQILGETVADIEDGELDHAR
jgi:hypothetical protein